MKALSILSLFFLISCSSRPERNLASQAPIVMGSVDIKHSLVRLYSSDLQYFYFEFRSEKNVLVDVELKDIVIQEFEKVISTHPRRISLGRYEIEFQNDFADVTKLTFLIQNQNLSHKLINLRKPSKKNSSVTLISSFNNEIFLRLSLNDGQNRPVEMDQEPEIFLDGPGEILEAKMLRVGVWEFSVIHPEENHIFYVTVRSNGVLMDRLFRFQHVEK